MGAIESRKLLASETPVGQFIPYSHHVTDTIISTKNAEYLSVWKIDGRSHQSASEADVFQWIREPAHKWAFRHGRASLHPDGLR